MKTAERGMNLKEAVKTYQNCDHDLGEADCETCPIGQRERLYAQTVCSHLLGAEQLLAENEIPDIV